MHFMHITQLNRAEMCSLLNRNPERPHIHGTQKKAAKELQPNIKVRLDRRTVITVRDASKLAYWKEKFPGLEILEES